MTDTETRSRPAPARSGRRGVLIAAAGAVVAVAVLVGVFAAGGGAPAARGEPAPRATFTYFDGTQGSFADFIGKPLVVNFWASWCPACVAEMPDFQRVHEALGEEVAFLGLNMQETSREAAEALVTSTGVRYVLAEDPDGAIYRQFGGFAMPTTIFIDAEGAVVGRQNGAIFAEDLEEMIRSTLLDG